MIYYLLIFHPLIRSQLWYSMVEVTIPDKIDPAALDYVNIYVDGGDNDQTPRGVDGIGFILAETSNGAH